METPIEPTLIRTAERVHHADLQTPGVRREQAFSTHEVWVGVVITEAGEMSAWHHHGDHDTYSFVVSGVKRIEYGLDGTQSLVAGPDDCIHVPRGLIHREGNPSGEVSRSIAFRKGTGPVTINVEGPPRT